MASINLEVEKPGKPNNRDVIKINPGTNIRMNESANGDITITLSPSLAISTIVQVGTNLIVIGDTQLGIIVKASLPTADPVVAGQWWADSGVVKVSAG